MLQFVDDYQAGISANQLAVRYQLSRSSVRRLLRKSGVPRRYQAMTKTEIAPSRPAVPTGLTISQMAAKLDRPWSTVQTALTRCGVARRGQARLPLLVATPTHRSSRVEGRD